MLVLSRGGSTHSSDFFCLQKHSIPISGIPCLHYRREKDKKNRGLEPVQTKRGEPVQSAESVPVQSAGSVPVQGNEWVPVQENGEMKKVVQNCDMEIPNGSTENPETEPKSSKFLPVLLKVDNMSLITRKPVFGVCDQVRLKPACSAIEIS